MKAEGNGEEGQVNGGSKHWRGGETRGGGEWGVGGVGVVAEYSWPPSDRFGLQTVQVEQRGGRGFRDEEETEEDLHHATSRDASPAA